MNEETKNYIIIGGAVLVIAGIAIVGKKVAGMEKTMNYLMTKDKMNSMLFDVVANFIDSVDVSAVHFTPERAKYVEELSSEVLKLDNLIKGLA